MAGTIDMQHMRYLNLFSKVSKVPTKDCFIYNNQIVFVVPKSKVFKAIGKGAVNVRKVREVLRKNVRVVPMPLANNLESIHKFIENVVDPVEFNKAELKNRTLVISAGRQSKASLIGRNRSREKELSGILKNLFGIEKLRIA